METLVLPEIFGVSPILWVPSAILLFVLLVIWFFIRRRRIYFDYLKDLTPGALEIVKQAKQIQGVVSGDEVELILLLRLILFSKIGNARVAFPPETSKERFYQALTQPRPWFLRWLEGPRAREVYQRACELAFWELPKVVRQERAKAIRGNERWSNFGFVPVEKLFEAILEKDSWLGGRLGILGRYLYPGWSFITWLLWGRGSVRFDKLTRAVCDHYLKETPEEGASRGAILTSISRDLTVLAKEGRLEKVVGRDKETNEVVRILRRLRGAKSPLLRGEPGVGKTAIVTGLAQLMVKGEVEGFENKCLIEVRGADLLGKSRAWLKQFLQEAADPRVILFIDEIHTLWLDPVLASELKPPLLRSLDEGGFSLIGATTDRDLREVETRDPTLLERFKTVSVDEMTVAQTTAVLKGTVTNYEIPTGCNFTSGAMEAAAKLTVHIPDHCRPRTAVEIMYAAAADYPGQTIGPEQIAEVVAVETGIALSYLYIQLGLVPEVKIDYRAVAREFLGRRIYGQNVATQVVLPPIVERYFIGKRRRNHQAPVAVVCAVGSTGNGKTESASLLAELIYRLKYQRESTRDQSGRTALLPIDLNDFTEPHSVSKLFGSPPGYVGYRESGRLAILREKPAIGVVRFDEVEKAAYEVLVALMKLMEGPIWDARGLLIDPKSRIFFFTSNIFVPDEVIVEVEKNPDVRNDILKGVLAQHLPREVVGRIDEVIPYRKLTLTDAKVILNEIMLPGIRREWQASTKGHIDLTFTEAAKARALQRGFSEQFGVRHLGQAVRSVFEDEISRQFAAGKRTIRI